MEFTVNDVVNASAELAAANGYPFIRVTSGPLQGKLNLHDVGPEPYTNLLATDLPWAVADNETIGGVGGGGGWDFFSAACWFTLRGIADANAARGEPVPLGGIVQCYGGAWGKRGSCVGNVRHPLPRPGMQARRSSGGRRPLRSPRARPRPGPLAAATAVTARACTMRRSPRICSGRRASRASCGTRHVRACRRACRALTVCRLKQVPPLPLPHLLPPHSPAQGEQNAGCGGPPQIDYYACALPALISDWRRSFGNENLPFGVFLLAAWGATSDSFPLLRLIQVSWTRGAGNRAC